MSYLERLELPTPSTQRIAMHVTPSAERSIKKGHPWLFENSIRKQNRDGRPGDIAIVFDNKNSFLAAGLYDPLSPIRVKILQHNNPATINQTWFHERLQVALNRRKLLKSTQTTGYRLIYGENDGLPALVIDRYNDTLVLKIYSLIWMPHLQHVITALNILSPYEHMVVRLSRNIQAYPEHLHGLYNGQILTDTDLTMPIRFMENGLNFSADVINGHKTGFFFDHRDNRMEVSTLTEGCTVLDVFSYTGAFSLYAALGGARSVLSLDVSTQALEAAKHNFLLNQKSSSIKNAKHEILAGDAFASMENLAKMGHKFDVVIVDPPSFAKSSQETTSALSAYAKLTRLATDLLTKSGILVMASCSSRVSRIQFFDAVLGAIDRPVREIKRTGHAIDHPVGFSEGEYLKCLFAYVD